MIQLIPQDEMVATSYWKEITKAYKYEMKPTKKQEVESCRTINTCKDLYNILLGHRKDVYENGGWCITYEDQQKDLPEIRNKNNELGEKLRKVYEQVEQNVADRVDAAYQGFYDRVHDNKENNIRYNKTVPNHDNMLSGESRILFSDGKYVEPGHSRFKGRNRYKSFTFPQYGNGCKLITEDNKNSKKKKEKENSKNIKIENEKKSKKRGIVRLSGIGDVTFIKHREIGEIKDKKTKIIIPYVIKTITIKKEIDKWFVIFTIETFVEIDVPIIPTSIDLNRITGIDLNLENYAALDGKKIIPKKYLRESEKKLAKEQRRLSRKKRYDVIDKNGNVMINKRTGKKITGYSKNGEKQKIKVAKVHRKIANQRENFGREISGYSVDNYDLLVFEKLSIDEMRQNRRYAKSISDAAWYQTQMFTKYKAEWAGKIVDFVDPKNTSQRCCYCGNIVHKEIWERTHSCHFCGLIIDRDYNSQIVILKRSICYIDIFKKDNISMKDDVLRRISMCKGIFQQQKLSFRDISEISIVKMIDNKVIMELSRFMPEEIGSISEKVKRTIRRRKINKNNITPGTGEGACLISLNRDVMIQEAPVRGGSSQPSFKKNDEEENKEDSNINREV